jgi:hypothetical protein
MDMLGGEKVRPPVLRDRALSDLIVDLKQALKIVELWEPRSGEKQQALRVVTETIKAVIAHLRRRRRQSDF